MTRYAQSLPSGAEPPAGRFANLSPFQSPNLPFNPLPAMNLLPLLLTASLCLLFSLAVYFLRERLQRPERSPVTPATGNDLPFDRTT
jgi:hypothetical protein